MKTFLSGQDLLWYLGIHKEIPHYLITAQELLRFVQQHGRIRVSGSAIYIDPADGLLWGIDHWGLDEGPWEPTVESCEHLLERLRYCNEDNPYA
mgnify:CR=1 FL=1